MDNEDDIYGEDIYGGSTFAAEPEQTGGANSLPSETKASSKSEEVLALERSIEDKDNRIADLEDELHNALTSVEDWKKACREGGGLDVRALASPSVAAAELRRVRAFVEKQAASAAPGDDPGAARVREAALQMQLAERNAENVELRRHAHVARACTDPAIAQVRQLLLDPAVQKEFERMKADVEAKAKEVKGLQEELQAVQFSQDSKAGRMLMAKCRALQDENEEMGKELAEGKVHALERQVALSKTFVEDMRGRYLELEDHAHAMDAESEELHQQVFLLRRQLREAEVRSVSAPRDRPMRPGPGGPKFNGPGGFGMGALPGPPGGGPPHGHHHGKFEMSPPDLERKRHPREGGFEPHGSGKRMR